MNEAEKHRRFAIDGREPQEVVFPESVAQVAETLRSANDQRLAVAPVGGGAFLHIGGLPRRYEMALCVERLNRVREYEPTEMTVTVEAGLSVARLQEVLAEHGQWLPIDPPCPERATVGGVIATNLSGPARLSQGTIRDFLLGLTVVRADGTVIKGGGRVVKNVAGYDVPKLYCGSLGTLGVITEATFKVRPRPQTQKLVSLAFASAAQAMESACRFLGSELPLFFLEFTDSDPGQVPDGAAPRYRVFVGLAGLPEEVCYQRARLAELLGEGAPPLEELNEDDARNLLKAARNFPVGGEAVLRCKASLLPMQVAGFCQQLEEEGALRGLSVQLLAHAGNGIVYTRIAPSETSSSEAVLSFIDYVRFVAKRYGGYIVIEDIAALLKERVDVWGHVGGAFPLMRRLKETFDPNAILNPGRFIGGL